MNKVMLMGRLVAEPDVKSYGKGKDKGKIARYRIAVDRIGSDDSDFISCVAFGGNAEFVDKYLSKGMKIAIVGSLRSGSYENDEGNTIYTTDVIVNEHYFCEKKKDK